MKYKITKFKVITMSDLVRYNINDIPSDHSILELTVLLDNVKQDSSQKS